MIITQRQLERLAKSGGTIVLPYRARLSPLAADYARHRGLTLGYAEVEAPAGVAAPTAPALPYLWWIEGASGAAQAALRNAARQRPLQPMAILGDATRVESAVRHLEGELRRGSVAGGVLAVRAAGLACVLANRSRHLRAVVATSLASVRDAMQRVAANVLILEHDALTLAQITNVVGLFATGVRQSDDALTRTLEEGRP